MESEESHIQGLTVGDRAEKEKSHGKRHAQTDTPGWKRNHSEIQNREQSTEEEGIRERHGGP